jgi:hypothetical protein
VTPPTHRVRFVVMLFAGISLAAPVFAGQEKDLLHQFIKVKAEEYIDTSKPFFITACQVQDDQYLPDGDLALLLSGTSDGLPSEYLFLAGDDGEFHPIAAHYWGPEFTLGHFLEADGGLWSNAFAIGIYYELTALRFWRVFDPDSSIGLDDVNIPVCEFDHALLRQYLENSGKNLKPE